MKKETVVVCLALVLSANFAAALVAFVLAVIKDHGALAVVSFAVGFGIVHLLRSLDSLF